MAVEAVEKDAAERSAAEIVKAVDERLAAEAFARAEENLIKKVRECHASYIDAKPVTHETVRLTTEYIMLRLQALEEDLLHIENALA